MKKKKKLSTEEAREELDELRKRTGWTAGALAKLLSTGGAGKGKGSNFERDTCRLLSTWWSEDGRDDLFWRSSQSGGRATQRAKSGKETFGQYGDITATHPDGYSLLEVFTIELKKGYNKDSFFDMFDKKTSKEGKRTWEAFFEQVATDAKKAKSLSWMLIWQRDRHLPMIFIPSLIINQLSDVRCDGHKPSKVKKIPHIKARVQLKGKRVNMFACELSDFLKAVKPHHIKKVNEEDKINKAKPWKKPKK